MPSPRYTLGRNELAEIETAARFGFAYVPLADDAEPHWLIGAAITGVGLLGFCAFMAGVGCLTGLACLLVEG